MVNQKPGQCTTISLDKESLKLVCSVASENDVSIAWVIRYVGDNFLKERKEGRQEQMLSFIWSSEDS